jgi:hypothetical protein
MPPHNEFGEERPLIRTNKEGVNGFNDGDAAGTLTARAAFDRSNAEASRQYHDSRTSANQNGSSQETWHQSEGGLLKVSFWRVTYFFWTLTVSFRFCNLNLDEKLHFHSSR